MSSYAIAALELLEPALSGAVLLKTKHPQVEFTSGRRHPVDQARAMASNVVHNRQWIEQTYKDSVIRQELQAWVDAHPDLEGMRLAQGLLTVMEGHTRSALEHFSAHLGGLAFDVQPITGPDGEAIKATIRGLAGLDLFLEREGGLVRWHAQFKAAEA